MKLFLCVVFIFSLAFLAQGQTDSDVKKSYDKFKNITSMSLSIGYFTPSGGVASWMVQAEYPGEQAPANPKIYLMLLSVNDDWKYLRKDLTVRTLLDEKRGILGKLTRAESSVQGGNATEILSMTITLKTLESLGNASSLEMQVVSDEFTFTKEQIEKFKTFADKLKAEIPPPATKTKTPTTTKSKRN